MTNRSVLVTGASRGIGRASPRRSPRPATGLPSTTATFPASWPRSVQAGLSGTGHTVVQAELADPAEVQHMVDAAAGHLGGLDVLVNNAANFTLHPITEVSYEQWQAAWQRRSA